MRVSNTVWEDIAVKQELGLRAFEAKRMRFSMQQKCRFLLLTADAGGPAENPDGSGSYSYLQSHSPGDRTTGIYIVIKIVSARFKLSSNICLRALLAAEL